MTDRSFANDEGGGDIRAKINGAIADVDRLKDTTFDTPAALLAASAPGDTVAVAEGQMLRGGPFFYAAAPAGILAMPNLLLNPVRNPNGMVSASQLGCEVARTQAAAVSAADSTDKLQAALDAGYDLYLDGWPNIAGPINPAGRAIIGTGNAQSGLWCSGASAGVLADGTGTNLRDFSIMSDYTAEILLQVGGGVEGDTLRYFGQGLFVYGAKKRNGLIMEYANGRSIGCIFRRAGNRDGSASIIDVDSHSVEMRCFHHFTQCEMSAATGYSLYIVGGPGWEEGHAALDMCRIQTGHKGLIMAANYSTDYVPAVITVTNGYFENPGLTHAGGVNNASLGPAIAAQGAIEMYIGACSKLMGRKATFLLAAYDGARISAPRGGAVKFSALGTSQLGALATVDKAPTTAFTAGLLVSHGGFLVTDSGTVYAPKADQIPFTTGATFAAEASKWIATTQTEGMISLPCMPPLRSNDSNAFSLTDWKLFIDTPFTKGRLPIDIDGLRLVKELIDGTSTAGLTLNVCTAAISSTAGEFISGTSALALTGTGSSGTANFSLTFDIPKHLVGKFLCITTALAYKQVGATFGSAGTMQPRIRVTAGTATVFPSVAADAQNIATNLTLTPGAGNLTDWYYGMHIFRPETAGTLTFTFVWDGVTGIRDDTALVDNVRLWILPSQDEGTIA
ncbi:hypothetical protein [Amaricoccus solimangrovi]|uniref:Uncharacterized protein n=1 Tax=Amaricoccus solimangrovi TaxID=2589815 RepID=A0A501WUY5_9RHOB|nr:hypothetical protein [Amaricoccus solimangrovi]TPE53089.1 hypothetical protein FJM51_03435 [Amaricoccus solimangrovi]